MENTVRTFTYDDGSIQRVQAVELPGPDSLCFLRPAPAPEAFERVVRLYQSYAVPRAPFLFDRMVLFRLPEDASVPFPAETERYGCLHSPLARAAAGLRQGVRIVHGKPMFRNGTAKRFWTYLKERGCLQTVFGLLPTTSFLPVSDRAGFLSRSAPEAAVKANLSFFTMDKFDVCSVYDAIGTPVGLRVRNGVVESPPLFGREALLFDRQGRAHITKPSLASLSVNISGDTFIHGENALCYERPAFRRTPHAPRIDLVIVENTVMAVHAGGHTAVPGAGFVLSVEKTSARPGDPVRYGGMEDILFGVQTGNSAVIDGVPAEGFSSPFYDIKRPLSAAFPPSLYPLDFEHARAPRMALGVNASGAPMLVWAEGPGKLGYTKGINSRGASLREMGLLCRDMGMVNGVNLDGGGSAQILIGGRRSLLISDRAPDNTELERAVPTGLAVYDQPVSPDAVSND